MNNHQEQPQPNNDRPAIEKLPTLEMYAVLGLELGKQIFEKLQEVNDSLNALAGQKARDLLEKRNEAKKKEEPS